MCPDFDRLHGDWKDAHWKYSQALSPDASTVRVCPHPNCQISVIFSDFQETPSDAATVVLHLLSHIPKQQEPAIQDDEGAAR